MYNKQWLWVIIDYVIRYRVNNVAPRHQNETCTEPTMKIVKKIEKYELKKEHTCELTRGRIVQIA